jgi:hypothetical protein
MNCSTGGERGNLTQARSRKTQAAYTQLQGTCDAESMACGAMLQHSGKGEGPSIVGKQGLFTSSYWAAIEPGQGLELTQHGGTAHAQGGGKLPNAYSMHKYPVLGMSWGIRRALSLNSKKHCTCTGLNVDTFWVRI